MTYRFKFGRLENLAHELPVIRSLEDRYRHTYILGTTGTGKTSLMMHMALNDINQGCACIFIDPKGEHTQALYNLIRDKDRVTYFSYDHPSLTINPLRKKGYRLSDLADEFAEILDIVIKQTSPANPPASENMKEILAQAISVISEPDRNIDFLYEFLRYPEVRKNYLKRGASRYWDNFDKFRPGGKEPDEVMTAKRIAVRLNKFVNDDRFRRIVTGENQLDIADIAKNRRVILVDASGMAMDKQVYITSLFSFALKSYCVFQRQTKEHPLMFYLDECWMGINDTFDFLLSFSRSYKIGLTLAHQNIQQFADYRTVKRIVSNCNTKVAFFPAGADDARMMAEIYGLEQEDFRNLEKYQAWVRIGNKNSLVKTYPPPKPEALAVPGGELEPEPARVEPPKVNFLRDCWFSC
jgi:type IV secretory pathway VirB4 component